MGNWIKGAVSLRVLTDSSVCKWICRREQALEKSDTSLSQCCGLMTWCEKAESRCPKSQERNPADLLTKYLPGVNVATISRALGFFVEGGWSDIVDAPYVGAEQSWRLSAMGRWSRGAVSAKQTVIALKPTASRAGRKRPHPQR